LQDQIYSSSDFSCFDCNFLVNVVTGQKCMNLCRCKGLCSHNTEEGHWYKCWTALERNLNNFQNPGQTPVMVACLLWQKNSGGSTLNLKCRASVHVWLNISRSVTMDSLGYCLLKNFKSYKNMPFVDFMHLQTI
jgi:hypothetical protein